jgi:hypothetical protein
VRYPDRSVLALVIVAAVFVGPASAQDIAADPTAPPRVTRSAPLFTLGEDGRVFLYRARPGDLPSTVAAMFGIPSQNLQAFLKANGISDATKVGPGFVYRIPNPVADEAAQRKQQSAHDERRAQDAERRAADVERQLHDAAARVEQAEASAARAARAERLWPIGVSAIVVLSLGLAVAAVLAAGAVQRQSRAQRYARTLAAEVEDKRRIALAERQESARRILDLEARVRELEMKLGPRAISGGRGA